MSVRPFHHQRPLAAAAAAYGAGVWAGVRFPWRPSWAAAGILLSLGAALLLPRIGKKPAAALVGAFLFLGMLISGAQSHPDLPPEGKYAVEGVLSQDAQARENGGAAYLQQVTLRNESGASYTLPRVYWTYYADADAPFLPEEGDRVSFSGNLYHPGGQENPYGFDSRLFYLQRGAAACISGARDAWVTGHPGRGAGSLTYRAKTWLVEKIGQVFGEGAALPRALLTGVRDGFPEDLDQAFSDAGIAHLLAVSGLHVTLLAGVLLSPASRLMSRKKQLILLAFFLAAYCALLDFAAPIVRASLLMLFACGRRLLRRSYDGLTALSAAFLLILLFRPLDLFSASFQLSFCAVLGIVAAVPALERKWRGMRLYRLRCLLAVTAAATVSVAVPTAQIFHRLSLAGPLINPAACLLFSVLLPLYALALLLGCVSLPLGQALAGPLNALSGWVSAGVRWVGAQPWASVRVPFLPWYCVAAVAAALALMTRYTVWPVKRKALAAGALLGVCFALWPLTACRDVQYIQLSVGQADCALILDGDQTAVIDAGSYGGDAAAYLLSTGRRADHLILTHLHGDHCLGVRQLLDRRVPIGEVCLPEGAEEQEVDPACLSLLEEIRKKGIPIRHLAAGDGIALNRVFLEAVWPLPGTVRAGSSANRYCLALLCDLDGVKLLSMSDVPGEFENYAVREADVLKAAHHGSKSSTGDAFLEAASPRAVIVTAGRGDALPHPDTLRRLSQRGIPYFVTGSCGAVTVTARAGSAELSTYLTQKEKP